MDITQTMYLFRQTHRAAVQLREKILQLRRVGMDVREVRPEIRIRHIRQTYRRYIALENRLAVIPQFHLAESDRIERPTYRAGQTQGSFERTERRNEKGYLRRHQLRFYTQRSDQFSRVKRQPKRYLAQFQFGVRQACTHRRHREHAVRQDHMGVQIFYQERRGMTDDG